MRSFWIWFIFLLTSWICAFFPLTGYLQENQVYWRIMGSAVCFAAFFTAPLFRQRPSVLFAALLTASICAVLSLWPAQGSEMHLYSLLVYSILAGQAAYQLRPVPAGIIGFVLFLGAALPSMIGSSSFPVPFLLLFSIIVAAGLTLFRSLWNRYEETAVRNETLLSEYRNMKRRLITNEQQAREEERAQVGRDIHDSVGHKLTALLMQLEVHRMQADEETGEVMKRLKVLAKESLDETRNAVKALKQQEAGGLTAIMGLLRRLESDSFMKVNLTARHGAFTAPLNNIQSIAVYRAVQEAMTNAMKHGSIKEVHILFEAPGGRLFRFEVSNLYQRNRKDYREGYGLRSMRERVEGAGGQLEITHYDSQFIVRGTFILASRTEEGVR